MAVLEIDLFIGYMASKVRNPFTKRKTLIFWSLKPLFQLDTHSKDMRKETGRFVEYNDHNRVIIAAW